MQLKYALALKWNGWIYGAISVELLDNNKILVRYESGKHIERNLPCEVLDNVGTVVTRAQFEQAAEELGRNPYSTNLLPFGADLSANAIFNYVPQTSNMQELVEHCVKALAVRDVLIDAHKQFLDDSAARLKRGGRAAKHKSFKGSLAERLVELVSVRKRGFRWPIAENGRPMLLEQQEDGYIRTEQGENAFGRRCKLVNIEHRTCTVLEACAAMCDHLLESWQGIKALRNCKLLDIMQIINAELAEKGTPDLPKEYVGMIDRDVLPLMVLRARLADNKQSYFEHLLTRYKHAGLMRVQSDIELTPQEVYEEKIHKVATRSKSSPVQDNNLDDLTDEQLMAMLGDAEEDTPLPPMQVAPASETPFAGAWQAAPAQHTAANAQQPIQGQREQVKTPQNSAHAATPFDINAILNKSR